LLPEEVKDGNARALQRKYMPQLKAIGAELEAHRFPYHFYFSRVLDIDEERQIRAAQRSIRFEKYQGHTVLAITGNYFAAYSGELMGKERARQKDNGRCGDPDSAFGGAAFRRGRQLRLVRD
jgi:hypothetical protein